MNLRTLALLVLPTLGCHAGGGTPTDIHPGYSDTADAYEVDGKVVSNVDIEARLWNPRGKSQEQIDQRAEYLGTFFDLGRTEEERAGDAEIRARYPDAVVINALMPSGVGIQGVQEEHYAEAVRRKLILEIVELEGPALDRPPPLPIAELLEAFRPTLRRSPIAPRHL